MTILKEFRTELKRRADRAYATWHSIDLHNHSPESFDYKGNRITAADDSAVEIAKKGLGVVMFTDHGKVPQSAFVDRVARQCDALVLRGVELNVFCDAFGKGKGQIAREAFFHLLIGFDPDNEYPAEYWLQSVYEKCGREERSAGSEKIIGVPNDLDKVLETLERSNAILVPAHLHSGPNAFRSRSIDDIYSDERFLSFVPKFTALEVTDLETATFFDGRHAETNGIEATCIRSSDAHEAERLGTRPSWILMQNRNFKELKASLEFRARVGLLAPALPDGHVMGIHINGSYLRDFWLPLSPYNNIFIGVKGSGKTAVLECLRFVLGVEVPKTSQDQVNAHLLHILGAVGRVRCLVARSDGSQVLVERGMANRDLFQLYFEDGRAEAFSQPHALGFPAQILGWHEIEHAATDRSVRRKYLNGIAGPETVSRLENEARISAERIRYVHEHTAAQYQAFRTLHDQVIAQEELRRGLQVLQDSQLIQLRDDYDLAIAQRDEVRRLIQAVSIARQKLPNRARSLLPFTRPILSHKSPLESQIAPARAQLEELLDLVEKFRGELDGELQRREQEFPALDQSVGSSFDLFARTYESAVAALSVEQRRLLDSHRQVLEQTRDLPNLQAQRHEIMEELKTQLRNLADLCANVTAILQERSDLRSSKLAHFSSELLGSGVKLELLTLRDTEGHEDYSSRYRDGFSVWQKMAATHAAEKTLHKRLRKAYEGLLEDLVNGDRLFFTNGEFSHYLTLFEDDDLAISFDPDPSNAESGYRPIDQLSAGQRCTAMFPLLLKLRQGPLVIDQPEDNLDNRHIATKICPVISTEKCVRQMIMTSHNANLLVLSDPENVVVFEGLGKTAKVLAQGYLGSRESDVTRHVLDILDGGQTALERRYARYGKRQ